MPALPGRGGRRGCRRSQGASDIWPSEAGRGAGAPRAWRPAGVPAVPGWMSPHDPTRHFHSSPSAGVSGRKGIFKQPCTVAQPLYVGLRSLRWNSFELLRLSPA